MKYKIVADSSCDLTAEQRKEWGVTSVPFILTLGDKCITDDDTLDLPKFIDEMKNCKERIGSAAPSPLLYKEAFQGPHSSFAVTLSSKLSASYSSAMLGKSMAEEEGADVHVFDSKSATAGEVLIALKLRNMISKGFQKSVIISLAEGFIKEMKTYFVLDSIDNLLKNGRLNKITGKLISVLNLKPIMGSDGDGNIALYSHARGQKQIIEKLADTVEASGRNTEGESMVITHCNNRELAEKLSSAIQKRYHFKEILIFHTKGLSSVYANDKGIVMAF